jgi:hypothetical protein
MGPTILFDKSFLQSLSVDESVFFDHFFIPAISPLFYVETLADLEKAVRQGRTPEDEVGIIATKVPEMSSRPLMYHARLALGNLAGHNVPMDGRIITPGGVPVKFEGKSGVKFDVPPEAEAFHRWQKRDFLSVERDYARAWRQELAAIDLSAVAAGMNAMGIDAQACKSLTDAKKIATEFLHRKDIVPDQIKLAFIILGLPTEYEAVAVDRWRSQGEKPLAEYAPYAAHVMSVDIFFQIALGANLIGTALASNRVDIAYLYYLPFCMVFVSSDNLHRRTAPEFLRADQSFVWGLDLKADLHRLMDHYSRLPDVVKDQGLMRFAPVPPLDIDGSLVVQLWDRHMNPLWRSRAGPAPPRDEAEDAKIIEHLNKFSEAPALPNEEVDFEPEDAEMIQLKRSVHKRKGSWWQLPKDLKEK